MDRGGSPYRVAATGVERRRDDRCADRDLLPVFGFVWAISLVRVVVGLALGEVFGAEATSAVVLLVLLPPALWGAD